MTRGAVLLAGLALVAGCAGHAGIDQVGSGTAPPSARATGTAPTTAAGISAAAPTRPYVLRRRLHVDGGVVVPGRFDFVVARARAWLAHRTDGPMTWGVGPRVHVLPMGAEAMLSTNGRWLAVSPGSAACVGDTGPDACKLRLLDTSGKDAPRRLTVHRTLGTRPGRTTQVGIVGVTDRGVVVLEVYDGAWRSRFWDAVGGARALQALADGLTVTDWQRNPEPVGLAPGGRWHLDTTWRDKGGARSGYPVTTRVLTVTRVSGRRQTVRLHPPTGWFFAESTSTNPAFWESPRAFVTLVVDARKGGDRLARCDVPLAACVLVAG